MSATFFRSKNKKQHLLLASACCLLLMAILSDLATADDPTRDAALAARAWISQIDTGHYDVSYNAGCRELHAKVDPKRWELVLKSIREPYGKVISRNEISRDYKSNGVPGLDGECVIVTYDTSFEKLESAREVVTLVWEDGAWLAAGYVAGPKPPPDGEDAAQQSDAQTDIETHTIKPGTPQP